MSGLAFEVAAEVWQLGFRVMKTEVYGNDVEEKEFPEYLKRGIPKKAGGGGGDGGGGVGGGSWRSRSLP